VRWPTLCWLACVALGACQERDEGPAWVGAVESAHSAADRARSPDERQTARRALEDAYTEVPQSSDPRQSWVRQDLCVRIGESALDAGQALEALSWAEKGLALSSILNVSRADLLGLKGRALEALGRKEEAASTLHEALVANQALMERALNGNAVDEGQP
jgi:tetratricopeptide (TPR) repeat protein